MPDPLDTITELLQRSLDDSVFSRAEKQQLSGLVQRAGLSIRQRQALRGRLFDIARQRISTEQMQVQPVLTWLEKATRALAAEEPAAEPVCQAYFSPDDDCAGAIVNFIARARQSLDVCVFTISDDTITRRLVQAHQEGIQVRILTDNDKVNDIGSDIDQFSRRGIPVRIDRTAGHMHHKFALRDRRELLTGSYNWTRSAARHNHENLLITDQPGAVGPYADAFDRLWQQMAEY